MNTFVRRLKTELRDVVELVFVPGLAVFLPWPLCFQIFKRLAHWSWLYRNACNSALDQAKLKGWVQDEQTWSAARRLVTLVDHADFYLAISRSDRWMHRYLEVEGNWPVSDSAAIFCTFHWGAGMWGLRHAALAGMHGHPLVAPLNPAHFVGRTVLYWYARQRTACVGRMVQQEPLDVSASLRPVLRALRLGEQVMAAVDVPADQVSASTTITILNLQARVPTALLRVAVEQKVPVLAYVTGINLETGARYLHIRHMPKVAEVQEMAQLVFDELNVLLMQCPPAWHFWSEAGRFFCDDGTP
jgi:lauroyl/myristoyl acyltransferase